MDKEFKRRDQVAALASSKDKGEEGNLTPLINHPDTPEESKDSGPDSQKDSDTKRASKGPAKVRKVEVKSGAVKHRQGSDVKAAGDESARESSTKKSVGPKDSKEKEASGREVKFDKSSPPAKGGKEVSKDGKEVKEPAKDMKEQQTPGSKAKDMRESRESGGSSKESSKEILQPIKEGGLLPASSKIIDAKDVKGPLKDALQKPKETKSVSKAKLTKEGSPEKDKDLKDKDEKSNDSAEEKPKTPRHPNAKTKAPVTAGSKDQSEESS